jgi:hypothetical protein
MSKNLKLLSIAYIAVNLVLYLAMVIFNTSFALTDWSELTRGIFSGFLALSFLGYVYLVLFSDLIE